MLEEKRKQDGKAGSRDSKPRHVRSPMLDTRRAIIDPRTAPKLLGI